VSEIREALAARDVDVTDLVSRAEAEARAEAFEVLRQLFLDDLLRRAAAQVRGRDLVALAGVADGVRPLTLELHSVDLADEAKLEAHVRAHNDLLLQALEAGAVVPFRFGTTFADRAELDGWVDAHRAQLERELDRLRGTTEWSVEVAGAVQDGDPRDYLHTRLATAVRPDVRARLAEASIEVAGHAYLVADRARFDAVLDDLQVEGYELRVTGPWPPYSFARLP
jgi:hypothetical protein